MNLNIWPKSDAEPDWDDDDPIILEQPPTWLYWNVKGQIVIRQQQRGFEYEMPFVFFSVANVPALISALREKLAELAAADSEQFERKPAKQPLTGAERQRRYKKKKRRGYEIGDENTCRGQETSSPGDVTGDRVSSLFPSPIGR